MKGAIIVGLSLLILGFGLPRWFNSAGRVLPKEDFAQAAPREVSVHLNSERQSGLTGSAIFSEEVVENLTVRLGLILPASASSSLPAADYRANIYSGSCAFLGKVLYPLTATADEGEVRTILPADFDQLKKELPLVIRVESQVEGELLPVACGEIEL